MTVVRNAISAIGTFGDVPNASFFHRVAGVVAKCLPITIVVRIVSGLQMVSEVDVGDSVVSVWPLHFGFCWNKS